MNRMGRYDVMLLETRGRCEAASDPPRENAARELKKRYCCEVDVERSVVRLVVCRVS